MAETKCKYYKQKRQVSYDGGQTWQDVIPYQYQRGELYEYESTDCGAVIVYRWVNMDASVDYYCEGTTKYYKQKRQVSYDGGQTWQDVSPAEYQKGGVAEQRSTDCGYVPPTPQYRWIKSDDTICVEILYRWVNMDASVDYYCEGTTKYYKQKKQVSNDGGQTWQDVTPPVYQKGGVAETQSTDCGYVPPQYRWVNMDASVDYYCEGTTKYYKQKKQASYDGGQTWQDVSPAEYQKGGVAETQSTDCGYVPPGPSPYESQYLTIVPRENGSIRFRITSSNTEYNYSMDSGATWVTGNSATTISTTTGNKVMFKGNLSTNPLYGDDPGTGNFVSPSGKFDVEGNPLSLLYSNFEEVKELTSRACAFYNLFAYSNVVSAKNLALPATTLANSHHCYAYMFASCYSLTDVPNLPATTLAESCYQYMFGGCTSLTKAPVLPATTLVKNCYFAMFRECSSLITPPELPATILTSGCYQEMFAGCTSLTKAPELPATALTEYCYSAMFNRCASLNYVKCHAINVSATQCTQWWLGGTSSTGTFVTPSSTNWSSDGSGIPTGWTRVDA